MKSKSPFFITLAVVAFAIGGFFVWKQRSTEVTSLKNSLGIVMPLIIKADTSALTPEQKKEIADFRALILNRIKSNTPLSAEEKSVIAASILNKKREAPGGMVLIDQSTYQFNADELQALSEALKR